MAQMNSNARASILQLILIPGIITLAITILRLVGELQNWSETWFNRSAGGPGAIIGIVWLAPIFGIYFALKLSAAGEGPAHRGKAVIYAILGLIIIILSVFLQAALQLGFPAFLIYVWLVMAAAAAIQFLAWPALSKALLAYGLAARIPVIIVMFLAMRGNWGTHYDAVPPNIPEMSFWPKFIWLGLVPQLTLWIGYTIVSGSLFGSIATAVLRRRKAEPKVSTTH